MEQCGEVGWIDRGINSTKPEQNPTITAITLLSPTPRRGPKAQQPSCEEKDHDQTEDQPLYPCVLLAAH